MSYLVKLEHFEGPLDLLLHLISKAKVQIEDISITEITEQYLETLKVMKEFDIEVASDFLVMAATLLHIKSCILLPKVKTDLLEEKVEDTDPRQELITKLLEYKKFKEASNILKKREEYFTRMYYKLPSEEIQKDNVVFMPTNANIDLLKRTLLLLFNNQKNNKREIIQRIHEIKRDPITVSEKINSLKEYFAKYNQTTFFKLFSKRANREDIIVTFLALLELLKENFLDVTQKYAFGDIVIKRRV